MYLDADGDGVHTPADVVSPTGVTQIDVWIKTDSARDGTPAACRSGDGPLTIQYYQVILHAQDGTVTWGPFVNGQPEGMPVNIASAFDTTDAFVSYYGGNPLPPGAYKLGSISASVATGTPSLIIATDSPLSEGYPTAFGSSCSGIDSDNFLKLGPNRFGPGDWFDADGLAFGGVAHHVPVLVRLSDVAIGEGETFDQQLSASDLDGDPLTFFKLLGPYYMQVITTDPGSGAATGRMTLRPGYSDAGATTGSIGVSDGTSVGQATFAIVVRDVNRPPVLAPLRDMTVEEGTADYQPVFVSDPDGNPVRVFRVAGPAYMEVNYGFVSVYPPVGAAGRSDSAAVAASDGFLLDIKSFRVVVKSFPVVEAPADMTVRVNATADQVLNARDPDGDPVTFSKASGPYYVTITTTDAGNGIASGLVHVAPAEFDVGSSEVMVEARDGTGSVQTMFRVTVVNPAGGGLPRGLFTSRFFPFDAGPGPASAATGDLNGDGVLDVVVANADFYSSTVSVLLGIRSGGFADRVSVPLRNTARSLELADLNGDGILDMAAAAMNSPGAVAVLFGRGDGTFLPSVDYPVGLNCGSVAIGDINRDGHADLAATSIYERRIRVWLNLGDGNFGSPYDLPSGKYPLEVRLQDLTQDGTLDLIVANLDDSTVDLFRGNGDGTFDLAATLPTADHPGSLAVGDLNADGRQDLVVANPGSNSVSVFLGISAGIVGPREDFGAGRGPSGIAIEDFDRDGRSDIAVTNSPSDSVTILFGNAVGTFAVHAGFGTGVRPGNVRSADFNLDGAPDILTSNFDSGTIAVTLGNGDGTFSDAHQIPGGERPFQAVSADFNLDGRMDLAVVNPETNSVSLLFGTPGGDPEPFARVETGRSPRSLGAADLNGDGYVDLVTANPEAQSVSVIMNHAGSSFGPSVDSPAGGVPVAIALGDLNGDDLPDMVVANVFEFGPGISVSIGRGDGTFGERRDILERIGGPLAIAKLDADSSVDIVTVSPDGYNSSVCEVLLGRGDGSFLPTAPFVVDRNITQLIAVDLNQDAKVDIALAGANDFLTGVRSDFVSVLLGNGDGSFRSPTDYSTGYSPQSLAAADFNADGRPDLAVANGSGNSVSLLLGNGGGTFGSRIDFGAGRYPSYLLAADLDGDGKVDLVTCDQGGGTLTILKNRGTAPPNRAPTADADGPYSGVAGVPVAFSGLGSSDPEGSQLTFVWRFGDGAEATGPQPLHTYRGDGRFQVSLTVSDGFLEGRDTTRADISADLPAVAFLGNGHKVLPVGVGPPFTCVQVEPAEGSFETSEAIASTIVLRSSGTGDVSEIHAIGTKDVRIWDRDHDGVSEIAACFGREDLHHLFSNVRGKKVVPAVVEGGLVSGARFRAPLEITVLGTGASSYSAVSANPIKAGGTLTFLNSQPGPIKVQLFDAAGRLVRTIAILERAEPGLVDVPLDGRSDSGIRLSCGVYFYKISSISGVTTGRLSILR